MTYNILSYDFWIEMISIVKYRSQIKR